MSTLKAKPEAPKNDNHTKFPSSIWTYVRSPKLGSDSARLLWLNVEISASSPDVLPCQIWPL